MDADGLPADVSLNATSSALSAPTPSPMDDPPDASGQHARHETGYTCVHRIEVGPSFSQKCASESCTHPNHTLANCRPTSRASEAVTRRQSSSRLRISGSGEQAIRTICADRTSGGAAHCTVAPATSWNSTRAAIARPGHVDPVGAGVTHSKVHPWHKGAPPAIAQSHRSRARCHMTQVSQWSLCQSSWQILE